MDADDIVSLSQSNGRHSVDLLDVLGRAESIQQGQVAVDHDLLPEKARRVLRDAMDALNQEKNKSPDYTFVSAVVESSKLDMPQDSVVLKERLPEVKQPMLPDPLQFKKESTGEPKEEENCYAKLYHQIDALNLRAAQVKQQLSKNEKVQNEDDTPVQKENVRQRAIDTRKDETIKFLFQELTQISQVLRTRSIHLQDKECELNAKQAKLEIKQKSMEQEMTRKVQARIQKELKEMQAHCDAQLAEKEERLKSVSKENARVQESMKQLVVGHRQLREKCQSLELELEQKSQTVEELKIFNKATKDRNERLRHSLETEKLKEKVVTKIKKVEVPVPLPRPRQFTAETQTESEADTAESNHRMASVHKLEEQLLGLIGLVHYSLRTSRSLAEYSVLVSEGSILKIHHLSSLNGQLVHDPIDVIDALRSSHLEELHEAITCTLPMVVFQDSPLSPGFSELYFELVLGFIRHLERFGTQYMDKLLTLGQVMNEHVLAKRKQPQTKQAKSVAKVEILQHLIELHCCPSNEIAMTSLVDLSSLMLSEEARKGLIAFGGVATLTRLLCDGEVDHAETILEIFLELSKDPTLLPRLAHLLLPSGHRRHAVFYEMLSKHYYNTGIRSAEIVERTCVLLQRLSTVPEFANHCKQTKVKDVLTSMLKDYSKEAEELKWEENASVNVENPNNLYVVPMGERTQNFVLMNAKSILHNIDKICATDENVNCS